MVYHRQNSLTQNHINMFQKKNRQTVISVRQTSLRQASDMSKAKLSVTAVVTAVRIIANVAKVVSFAIHTIRFAIQSTKIMNNHHGLYYCDVVIILIIIIIMGTYMRPISGEPEALINTQGEKKEKKFVSRSVAMIFVYHESPQDSLL